MNQQTPPGPADLVCPLHRKSMAKVCHTCPLWVKVTGKDPQNNLQTFDQWACSLAWLPMLLIENSQRQMQTAAAVGNVSNEVQRASQQSYETTAMLTGLLNRAMDIPRAPALTNGAEERKLLE